MVVTFGAATLGDYTASPKLAVVVETWPGTAEVQPWQPYNSDARGLRAAGCVGGPFVCSVFCSYSGGSVVTAVNALIDAYITALTLLKIANATADLTVTPYTGSHGIKWANSVMRSAQPYEIKGVGMGIRYTIETKGVPVSV